MVGRRYIVGDLVWAKMKGFPPWPAKIINPPAGSKPVNVKKPQHYCFFFGTENYASVLVNNIFPHSPSMLKLVSKIKSSAYQIAVEAIKNCGKETMSDTSNAEEIEKNIKYAKKEENFEGATNVDENEVNKNAARFTKKTYYSTRKKDCAMKKRKELKRLNSKKIKFEKVPKKMLTHPLRLQKPEKDIELLTATNKAHDDDDDGHFAGTSTVSIQEQSPEYKVDLETVNKSLLAKHVIPTKKRIGFIGLGRMGQHILKNIIHSGHQVAVWNRKHKKCDNFAKAGALKCETPADVVKRTDIIFCCISDPDAVKSLVFQTNGILSGLSDDGYTKGYVEMTSVDPESSMEMANAIMRTGARYLEAQVKGSIQQANEGSLFLLASGDRTLFTDCETCFNAMGQHAYFLGTEVGCAPKMSLIHSMLHGTVHLALDEAMTLAERVHLSQSDLFNIIQHSNLRCPALIEKSLAILTRNYDSNTDFKYIQKDMLLAVELDGYSDQQLPVTAAANEVYKHAKQID